MYAMTENLSTYAGSLGVTKAAERLEAVDVWATAAKAKSPTPALRSDFEGYDSTLDVAVTLGLAIDFGKSSHVFSGPAVEKVPTRQNLLLGITSSGDTVSTMRGLFTRVIQVCPGFKT
jgi:hypothetical protein